MMPLQTRRRGLWGLISLAISLWVLLALWRKRHMRSVHFQRRMRERARFGQKKKRAENAAEENNWHETLAFPRYEWWQFFSWKIVSFVDGRCHVDELNIEKLVLRKRYDGQQFSHLRSLIGNTPMLAIKIRICGRKRTILMKCEHLNFTGSIKDRMALHILDRAYADGSLKRGDIIAEASSGNTGIAFSAIGSALGHPVVIYMPDWMSNERKTLIRSYGADIVLVSRLQGGFVGSIQRAEAARADQKERGTRVFLPRQFQNEVNAEAHYLTTGPEILLQLSSLGLKPAAFVAGVGTGGTIMGVGRCIRELMPHVQLHPVEPAESPTLSTGHQIGYHRIQGISDEFVPPVLKLEELDDIVSVPDGDAIIMAQKLARTLGIGVGISAGANFLAAAEIQDKLGTNATVVSIICDDNKKYLSTDLARPEPVRPGYRCRHIELQSFEVIPPLSDEQLESVRSGRWKEKYSSIYGTLQSEIDPKPGRRGCKTSGLRACGT